MTTFESRKEDDLIVTTIMSKSKSFKESLELIIEEANSQLEILKKVKK